MNIFKNYNESKIGEILANFYLNIKKYDYKLMNNIQLDKNIDLNDKIIKKNRKDKKHLFIIKLKDQNEIKIIGQFGQIRKSHIWPMIRDNKLNQIYFV